VRYQAALRPEMIILNLIDAIDKSQISGSLI